jgi:hypothetical protein
MPQPPTVERVHARPGERVQARRPPAPADHVALVTDLVPSADRREAVPVASVQGTLALELDVLPAAPPTPRLQLLPGEDPATQREVKAWAARFAQATVEVLGGDRPLTQLLRWTDTRVYADLERRVQILGRSGRAPQRLRAVRPQVHSVHVFRPGPASAEVSVHVRAGQRSRAIAARLEQRDGRWRCVALQLG